MNSEKSGMVKLLELCSELLQLFTSPGRIMGALMYASVALLAVVIDVTSVSVPYTEVGISKQVHKWNERTRQ